MTIFRAFGYRPPGGSRGPAPGDPQPTEHWRCYCLRHDRRNRTRKRPRSSCHDQDRPPGSPQTDNAPVNILTGWREQYDRMIRSHDRLVEVATGSGREVVSSDDARDRLINFYLDAYHLKDWIKNDPAAGAASRSVEGFVKNSASLRLCADLANGAKHLRLTTPKTGDPQNRHQQSERHRATWHR